MDISINGLAMPEPALPFITDFQEVSSTNETLNGSLYTDYLNQRRVWRLFYPELTEAQYDLIRAEYDSQFTSGDYVTLQIDDYDILVTARMEMNSREVRRNGGCVRNIKITLTEQFGFLGVS